MAAVVGPYENDLSGFSFILPIFSIRKANVQKTIYALEMISLV